MNKNIPAFVINLKRRPDRLFQFQKENIIGEYSPEIIPVEAVDANSLDIELIKERIHPWNLENLTAKKLRAVIACCLSHLSILEKISEMDCKYAFVFEDDAVIFQDNWNKLITNLDSSNFDIIWLNEELYVGKSQKLKNILLRTFNFLEFKKWTQEIITAEAYAITPKTAKLLYDETINNLGAADAHFWGSIKRNGIIALQVVPPLFSQRDRTDTDIQKDS